MNHQEPAPLKSNLDGQQQPWGAIMEWVLKEGRQRPDQPAQVVDTPSGPVKLPPRKAPRPRDGYSATLDVDSWPSLTHGLVEFWLQVCAVFPRHLNASHGQDWDRLLISYDTLYGKLAAQPILGVDYGMPRRFTRGLCVGLCIPFVAAENEREMPDPDGDFDEYCRASHELTNRLLNCVRASVADACVVVRLRGLSDWHRFSLYLMAHHAPESLRPLDGAEDWSER